MVQDLLSINLDMDCRHYSLLCSYNRSKNDRFQDSIHGSFPHICCNISSEYVFPLWFVLIYQKFQLLFLSLNSTVIIQNMEKNDVGLLAHSNHLLNADAHYGVHLSI